MHVGEDGHLCASPVASCEMMKLFSRLLKNRKRKEMFID